MKKISIYFFTAMFFVSGLPIKCDWPYPTKVLKSSENIQQQQLEMNVIQTVDITKL